MVDAQLSAVLNGIPSGSFASTTDIGQHANLAIIVGGDGNMLGAARALSRFKTRVIGVNRGSLGFLTDLSPEHFDRALERVLSGHYLEENRFLLEARVQREGHTESDNIALNEAVLHTRKVARMIDFEVYIDDKFAFSQRSDGLIVSTPTGSTAYSLSGGGPILAPSVDAIALVPMFPHTLSSRPLVVDSSRNIMLSILPQNLGKQEVSCDGQVSSLVLPGDEIHVSRSPDVLHLIHPEEYSYYRVLREKLSWSRRFF